ncbi:MAG TPA: trehalose-phosphatase [Gaiellaceae bacterium]|nr:trehalose-phosphatase [Gaiellaceae bacterium]
MEALARLTAEPAFGALFFDVDGVLAPIVAHPEDAAVPEETRAELRRLAAKYALVACVTGRATEVAQHIVGVPELRIVGEHGLELDPRAAEWAPRIHAFAEEIAWHDLELKPLSAAFHYRRADDHEFARAELEAVEREARVHGFKTRFGRFVLEVLPPIPASKGTGVTVLLKEHGLNRALYAGDDTTDLDGFAALDKLEVAVRVAVASVEGPSELAASADIVVGSTGELLDVVRAL